MYKIYNNSFSLIGKTPLINLKKYSKYCNLNSSILAKLEWLNPTGSIKDRIALFMIEKALKNSLINKETVLIEPTSGNTGIGLAFIAAIKKIKLILTMPSSMSKERRNLIEFFGAKVKLTNSTLGMKGSIEKANNLNKKISNSLILNQFENPANIEAHRLYTGKEIIKDITCDFIDFFISGVGTGGTLTGVGETLKKKYPKIKIIAVEPFLSPVISGGKPKLHKIEGIGAGFIPKNLKVSIINEIITIKDIQAYETVKKIAKIEGLLIGISSGAAIYAATIIGKRKENKGKNIVVILPDNIDKYLSTNLFS